MCEEDEAPSPDRARDGAELVTLSRWFRRGIAALVGGVLAFVAIGSYRQWQGQTVLNKQLRSLRARGVPTTYAEIEALRPTIPEERNLAVQIQRLFPALDELASSRELHDRPIPMFGAETMPAWNERWPVDLLAKSRRFLDEQRDVLDRLRVAEDLPTGRFPLVILQNEALPLKLVHLSRVRTATKLELLQAACDAQLGDVHHALWHGLAALHLSATLQDEPSTLSLRVYVGTGSLACDAMERGLAGGEAQDDDLAGLIEKLKQHERHNALLWGIRGEIVATRMRFDSLPVPFYQFEVKGWLARDEAASLGLIARLLETVEADGDVLAAAEKVMVEADALPEERKLTRILLPSLQRAIELFARWRATERCTLVGLCAERFRMKHGRWPATLEELVPEYIDAVPIDPFAKTPLIYDVRDDMLIIYSVCENGVDDGGNFERLGESSQADVGFRLLPRELRLDRRPATQPAGPPETQPTPLLTSTQH